MFAEGTSLSGFCSRFSRQPSVTFYAAKRVSRDYAGGSASNNCWRLSHYSTSLNLVITGLCWLQQTAMWGLNQEALDTTQRLYLSSYIISGCNLFFFYVRVGEIFYSYRIGFYDNYIEYKTFILLN